MNFSLFGFMAIVPPRHLWRDRAAQVSMLVRQSVIPSGMTCQQLAAAMRLAPKHLSRQFKDGLNFGRLANPECKPIWLLILRPLTEIIGFTRAEVLALFDAESDVTRDERDKQRDAEIADLRRQMAEILKRLPPVKSDESETRVA